MKNALTILLGLVIIAVLTPLAQISTIAMINHDLETSAASGWVFGLLFSFVLAALVLRLIARRSASPHRPRMVLLFAMLSLAVPVMNLGVARLILTNLTVVQEHFLGFGVDTYRRAYEEQSPDWFPIVPTREGLAYQKADQVFRLLQDAELQTERQQAYNDILLALRGGLKRLERDGEAGGTVPGEASDRLGDLGLREVERLRQEIRRDAALSGLVEGTRFAEALETEYETLRLRSEAALAEVREVRDRLDERLLYFAPSVRENQLDRGTRLRLEKLEEELGAEASRTLREEAAALDDRILPKVRARISELGGRDLATLQRERYESYLRELRELDDRRLAEVRTEFLYRLRSQERKAILGEEGSDQIPGHDFSAMIDGVFQTGAEQARMRERGFLGNLRAVWDRISWPIWTGPLLRWGGLMLALFLFLMCLAEWLRRKWVERENLAFPLVEVADHLIRHDFRMETAEDLVNPPVRGGKFAGVFWAGFALGALMLLFEAHGHYTGSGGGVVIQDVQKEMFASTGLQELKAFVFVLSPILLGIFFLVNLEISFSVWSLYLIFRLAFFAIAKNSQTGIRDPEYLGWASKFYPFEMEQMLGAGLCFGVLLMIKAFKGKSGAALETDRRDRYVPSPLMVAGLAGLPLVMGAMAHDMGMENMGLFALMFVVLVLLGVTAARLRAETGLPLQHAHVDFTRLPLMLGMSRMLSVRSFVNYVSLVFLPVTLMVRLLPQQLENLELARRHRLRGRTLAVAGFLAFVTALSVGLLSLLTLSHWIGAEALGRDAVGTGPASNAIAAYPLWVTHFFGEEGLSSFTEFHRTRLLFVGVGAALFGLLTFLRARFLKFPFHPIGYLLFLFSIYHTWLSPYYKGTSGVKLEGASWLWGSALIAWGLKKLIIKYGGMNTYRAAKPAFIGLIVGSLVTLFAINAVDLTVGVRASRPGHTPTDFEKMFLETPAYTPKAY